MKHINVIAVGSATLVASAALGTVTSYASQATWDTAAAALTGEYTDPGSFAAGANLGGIAYVYSGGWENYSVSAGSGGTATWSASDLVLANSSAGAVIFTFNFYDAPTSGTGIWGFYLGINPALSGGASNVGLSANGTPFNGVGPFTSFIGFLASQPADGTLPNGPITSFQLTLAAGATLTATSFGYAIVPAPGAIALLGAAGLVSARRRRA